MIISKLIGDKRRWRAYRARVKALPPHYGEAVDALERYLLHFGPEDGESVLSLMDDLADLFEQAAADGTPIREIVGEDPVEFVETLRRNYPEQTWRNREQERLITSIDRAVGDTPDAEGGR